MPDGDVLARLKAALPLRTPRPPRFRSERACASCGAPFVATSANRDQQCCGQSCAAALRNRKRVDHA